jgi:hypothetical protein
MLKERYVPLALDVFYSERSQDAMGEFYRKVVKQSSRYQEGRTTQGFYIFQPTGELVVFWNNRGPKKMRQLLEESRAFEVSGKVGGHGHKVDGRYDRTPPAGGLVLDVFSRILGGQWAKKKSRWDDIFRSSTGHDHLWLSKAERRELVAGKVPKGLALRVARFHLPDNTRGEPPMWRKRDVRKATIEFRRSGRKRYLVGEFEMKTTDSVRTFRGSLLGEVVVKGGKLARFDFVVRGLAKGRGKYTQDPPVGEYPIGYAFRLADRKLMATRVPPQGSRDLGDYMGR